MEFITDKELCNTYALKVKETMRGNSWTDPDKYGTQYSTSITNVNFDKVLNITFRGSDNPDLELKSWNGWRDWFWNLVLIPIPVKPYKGSKWYFIHYGFLKRYKMIRKEIHEIIKSEKPQRIHIDGFSLGAAIAALCFEDMRYNFSPYVIGENSITCSVSGLPRFLFFIGAKKFRCRISDMKVYIHGNDLVSRLPFTWLGYVNSESKSNRVNFCSDHKRNWWPFSKNAINDHISIKCCLK